MHVVRRLAALAILACGLVTPAIAIEPDDLPWDEIDRVLKEQPLLPADSDSDDAIGPPSNARDEARPTSPQRQTGRDIGGDRLDPERAPVAAVPAEPRFEPAQVAPPQQAAPTPAPTPAQAATPQPTQPVQPVAAPPAPTPPAAAPEPVQAMRAPPAVATPPTATPPPAPAEATTAPPPLAVPSTPVEKATVAVNGGLYLPLKRYFDTKAVVTLKDFDEADRTALAQFYTGRMGQTLWVSKDGFNAAAENVFAVLAKADDWGLSASDYKIPRLAKIGSGEFHEDDLAEAEIKLSLVAMEYARHARGDRIDEPSVQLSSYLDRKPQLIERPKLLDALAAAPSPGDYLRGLHPKHEQFERLRQQLVAFRAKGGEPDFEKIPDGPKITPGKVHWQVGLVRRRLKIATSAADANNATADENFYDAALAQAIEQFKSKNQIEPVNATITSALRKALNTSNRISEEMLLANMEQWRWMPEDLGATHILVNIPEFLVRVVKNGNILHEERIVVGKQETQTPIFSNMMRTIVFQPPWNVPESIKVNELLPGLRSGNNPIEKQGLVLERNGRQLSAWDVDWNTANIREYHIFQPPGDANVLGIVKFLFPNKHSVYLHDTPSKRLFEEKVRTFSHGCMRVRNPVQLAEAIMAEDKGWDKSQVNELITSGPEDNSVSLDKPLPVHVTYFTAWVADNGELKTFADVYGHEQRVKLGLEGRWGEIVKNRDHLLPAEDVPVASNREDWGDSDADEPPRVVRRSRQPLYTYREPPPPPYKNRGNKGASFGSFLNKILGGN